MTRMQKTELYLIHPNQCLAFNTFTSLATKICFSLLRRVSRTDSFLKEMFHGYLELNGRIIWYFLPFWYYLQRASKLFYRPRRLIASIRLQSTEPHICDHILSSKICCFKAPDREDFHAFLGPASVTSWRWVVSQTTKWITRKRKSGQRE